MDKSNVAQPATPDVVKYDSAGSFEIVDSAVLRAVAAARVNSADQGDFLMDCYTCT